MNQKCSIQECSNDAVKSCNCQNKPIFFCELHIKYHEKGKNHKLTEISPQPKEIKADPSKPSKKQKILDLCLKKLCQISQLKNQIIKASDDLIKLIYETSNTYMKKLTKDEKELRDITFKIVNKLRINKEEKFPFVEKLKVKKFLKNDEFFPQLCQSVKNYFSMNLNEEILNLTVPNTFDNKVLFGSNGLNILDLSSNERSVLKNFPKFLPSNVTGCRVNKDTYFINGVFSIDSHRSVWTSYLINVKSKDFLELPKGFPRKSAGSVLRYKKVYVFGGENSSALDNCESFDLVNREWTIETSLPKPSTENTAGLIGDDIIVSGFQLNDLYLFREGSFKQLIPLNSKIKVVCNGWVLTASDLYENNDSKNLKAWSKHSLKPTWSKTGLNILGTFYKDKFIYFADSENSIWRIDTVSKKISKIPYN